ncbi:MAG: PQQ-dependent sugar dehydrogenase [Bacteroidota bacterium]
MASSLSSGRVASLVFVGLVVVLAAASFMADTSDPDTVHTTEQASFRVETVAEGLEVPWGLAFLPDGRLLVAERGGTLRSIGTDGTVSDPIGGVPAVYAEGQGGLMEVKLHPNYDENGWIYLGFSDVRENEAGERVSLTAVSRARLDGTSLVDLESIYQGPLEFYTPSQFHFGTRIVFDEDGFLYFTIGDRGQRTLAQNLDVPYGKVHRLHDDGRVPADNPFVDQADALDTIWSYGHRNPQGMDIHPATGGLFETEHGPKGGDELNLVERGLNYGWPVITYGINYNGTPITDQTEQDGMEQPVVYWTPSIAVCGIEFYTGTAFPEWENDLFVTSLMFAEVRRLEIENNEVVDQEVVYQPQGRIRDVTTGPDGALYVAVESGNSHILRLVPADA